jgi:hypothetical protein
MTTTPIPTRFVFEQGTADFLPVIPPNTSAVEVYYDVSFKNKFIKTPSLTVGVVKFQVSANGASGVIYAEVSDLVADKLGFKCKLRANIQSNAFGKIQLATVEYAAYGPV